MKLLTSAIEFWLNYWFPGLISWIRAAWFPLHSISELILDWRLIHFISLIKFHSIKLTSVCWIQFINSKKWNWNQPINEAPFFLLSGINRSLIFILNSLILFWFVNSISIQLITQAVLTSFHSSFRSINNSFALLHSLFLDFS